MRLVSEREDNRVMRWISPCLVIVLVAARAWSPVTAATQEPIRIAGRWELLVDHYLVDNHHF